MTEAAVQTHNEPTEPVIAPAPAEAAITTEAELRALLGEPMSHGGHQGARPALDESTALAGRLPVLPGRDLDAEGAATSRRRATRAGFAVVLDDRTVALPERAGNRRADSLHNVLEIRTSG